MGAIKIRHQYDGEQDKVSHETGLDCSVDGDGQTKQSAKEECDINFITRRYERSGGVLSDLIKENPRYGDFSEVPDFQEALNLVHTAEAQFAALDASLRARFGNDPAQFLAFATDKRNLEEMVRLGLATSQPADQPPPAAAAPAARAAASKKAGSRTTTPLDVSGTTDSTPEAGS